LRQLQDRQASLLHLQRESERRLNVTPVNRRDERLTDGPGIAAAAAGVDVATEV